MRDTLRSLSRGPALLIGCVTLLLILTNWQSGTSASATAFLLCLVIAAIASVSLVAEGRTRRHTLARTTAILVSLSMASVAAEYATRWVFRDVTTTADDRGFFTKRWARSGADRTNSFGFREHEFGARKEPGVYRIAVVGDSFTYGNGLPAEQRFSALLQQALPANVEVLNFGVAGDNTPEHAILVEQHILGFDPDFILVQWFVNDVEGSSAAGRPTLLPLMPLPSLHAWLFDHSALYTLLNSVWSRWQVSLHLAGSYPDYIRRRVGDPQSEDSRKDRAAMERLVALGRSRGVGIGFVLFPDSGYDLGPDYPFAYLDERELEFCRSASVACVDLWPEFAKVKDRRTLWVDSLDHHPSAQANAIAAMAILRTFGEVWTRGAVAAH